MIIAPIVRVLYSAEHFHLCVKKCDITFRSALQLGLCVLGGDLGLAKKLGKSHKLSVLRALLASDSIEQKGLQSDSRCAGLRPEGVVGRFSWSLLRAGVLVYKGLLWRWPPLVLFSIFGLILKLVLWKV